MNFQSLNIKNFGVLKGPLGLTFGPGLNVIHGPNESGKSTLVGALWAALTLRHRVSGDIRQRLAYVPRGGGVPEARVGFEQGGVRYEVEKRFAGARGTARLRIWRPDGAMEDLADADAEARLQAVLGTTPGADGKRDEELGVLPLLWVRQERSSLLPSQDLHESGRQTLSDILGSLSGDMLGGPEAERLFDASRLERDRFFTPTGQPKRASDGPFFAVSDALRQASTRLGELERRQADHEHLLDQQDRIASELEALARRAPELEARHRSASARAEDLRVLREQVASAKKSVEIGRGRATEARRRYDERTALLSQLSEEKERAERLTRELGTAKEAAAKAPNLKVDREAARVAAETEDARQRRLWERLDAHVEVLRARAEVDRRAAELERARALSAELAEAKRRLAPLKVDASQVSRLDSLDRQVTTSDAALEAASARVEVTALAELGMLVGDRPLSLGAGESWDKRLDRPLTLRISELVEVSITPGGKDLDALRRRAEESRQALGIALGALGVGSLAEARAIAEERRALTQQVEHNTRQLEVFGQGGPEALGRTLEQLRVQLAAREKVRAAATRDGDPPLPSDPVAANSARAEVTAARERARQAAQNAREALHNAEREADAREAELRRAEERHKESTSRLGHLVAQLSRQRGEWGEDEPLKRKASEEAERLARESQALDALSASLDDMSPAEVDRELLEATAALRTSRDQREALERARAEVVGALSAADLVGLHEKLASARAEVEANQDQLNRLNEQAETARLLYETLDSARNQARERYLGPLQGETERLLHRLFPEATAIFDDQLQLKQLNRNESDTFDVLSVGTREQVGVVVRLAMASVLATVEPVPVILDDALVATDEARFLSMIPLFAECAKRHQIVLLTCHWSRYQAISQVADRVIDLGALKRAAI